MTQKDVIIELLLKQGYVDNYYCIDNKISIRLGAIIFVLKQDGWDFRTEMVGKNCHYYPIKKPSHVLENEQAQKTLFRI